MEAAYLAAFAAHERCSVLMNEAVFMDFASVPTLHDFGLMTVSRDYGARAKRREELQPAAEAEDVQADLQAGLVLLTTDDALQRFARAINVNLDNCGPRINDVPFSTLVRAATNAIRHVSEWDDDEDLKPPYTPLTEIPDDRAHRNQRFAMRSIETFQKAFGIGIHDRITDVVSFRVLMTVDRQLGTAPPSFARFASAVVSTARDVAQKAGPEAVELLDEVLHPQFTASTTYVGFKADATHSGQRTPPCP